MLEIIALTLEDAIRIEACGAHRIELVSALTEGGLTPSLGLIKAVVQSVKIPVNVMVRPHSQSFTYTDQEIEIMKADIQYIRSIGANGVVLGVLDLKGDIDFHQLDRLLEVVGGMDVTFHRAIDVCSDIEKNLEELTKRKCITNVLSSGGEGKAVDHLNRLNQMNRIVERAHVKLLIGSGVNEGNIRKIKEKTGAKEFHVGTAARIQQSSGRGIDNEITLQILEAL